MTPFASPEALAAALRGADYIADEGLAVAAFLALGLQRPLLVEGVPGVGKTEAAKALAAALGRDLIRLQCYEGIDASQALYEWNYARQLLAIRQSEGPGGAAPDIYAPEFLIERPLLKALRHAATSLLLIDEIDRADDEFEAFLLEFLADYEISIPEIGTVKAPEPPIVILTSNRTRELHEALRRRCTYHWIPYPDPDARGGDHHAARRQRRGGNGARRGRRGERAPPPAARQGARHLRGGRLGARRADPGGRHRRLADCAPPLHRPGAEGRGGSCAGRRQARRPSEGRVRLTKAETVANKRMPTSNPPHAEVLAAQAASLEARTMLPRAVTPFTDFARQLRNYGFPVVTEQTIAFLRAIALLGPRSTRDLYWAARATLAPPPDRLGEFDALFRAAFEGEGAVPVLESIPEEGASVKETGAGALEPLAADNANESGAAATSLEALSLKRFAAVLAERSAQSHAPQDRRRRAAPPRLPPGLRQSAATAPT